MLRKIIFTNIIILCLIAGKLNTFSQNISVTDSLKAQFVHANTYNDSLSIYYQIYFRYRDNNKDSAKSYLKDIIFFTSSRNKYPDFVEASILLSHIYLLEGDYSKSILLLNSVQRLIADKDQNVYEAKIFKSLGEIYRASGFLDEALNYLQMSLDIYKNLSDSNGMAKTYNRFAAVYYETSEYDLSADYCDSSMLVLGKSGEIELRASNFEIYGSIYRNQNEYKKATEFLIEALAINYQINNTEDYINNLINLQITYYRMKDYTKAMEFGKEAYKMSSDHDIKVYLNTSALFLAYTYAELNQYEAAFEYHEIAVQIKGQLSNEKKKDQISDLNNKYLQERNKNQLLDQKRLARQNKVLNFSFAGIAVLLILLILILVSRRNRLKKTNLLLHAKNEEIKGQSEQIEIQKDKLRRKAADLLVLNMRQKEVDDLKDGLTGMLVHDLKNPINNILNLTDQKEITSFANQMLNIVNNILDVQKFENAKMVLRKKEHSAYQAVTDAIQEIKLLAEHKNIKIENKVVPGFILDIDVDIIERIFVNLMTNSIKYTPANGRVTVSSEFNEKTPDYLYLKVSDTGIGIQKSKIDTIFNKFNQVIAKKSGHARSTGLGLTFCKMAVEAHGGEITVTSNPDVDTSFIFNLPLANVQEIDFDKNDVIIVGNELDLNLDKTDKDYLKDFVKELKDIEVYDISNLRRIMDKIEEGRSDNISAWKKELDKAIYNCNPEQYHKILNI